MRMIWDLSQNGKRALVGLFLGLVLQASTVYAQQSAIPRPNPSELRISGTDAQPAFEQQKMFHLPPGFVIDLVASEPQVIKPINLNFDANGRLLVSQSVEYPFVPPLGQTPRDTIRLLTDTDGDGITETISTFADGLRIPVGLTSSPDGVMGYSVPNIYRFPDGDRDGHADARSVAYQTFGYGDTHGMVGSLTWWIDGWVYGTHSNNNRSVASGSDGHTIDIKTGHIHRFRPDGSHIEFFTHGQVNPFGITFDPFGNMFSADSHTKPISMMLRGAYYPDFFKPHDGLGFAPTMMRHTHGSTGLAGIVYYAADRFPPKYRDTIFVGNPVTGRINHDKLEAHGSTYRALEQPDFLTCDDPWFRPVDLQLAPDGSIYISDFYAPIISHYEVTLTHPRRDQKHGRIWRVSYVGEGEADSTQEVAFNLTAQSTEQLVARLADSNLLIRIHATHQLVHRIGSPAVDAIESAFEVDSTPAQRSHAIWVLSRLGSLDLDRIESFAHDRYPVVRVHLMKAMAELPEWEGNERAWVIAALTDEDAFVRRAAAEALGLHPHLTNVIPLIDLWDAASTEDTHLIHVVRISIRNNIRDLANLPVLAEQLRYSPGRLARLANICLGIKTAQSALFLLDYHLQSKPGTDQLVTVIHHIGRYLNVEDLDQLENLVETFDGESELVRLKVVRALINAGDERGVSLPSSIADRGTTLGMRSLNGSDDRLLYDAIEVVKSLKTPGAVPALVQVATSPAPRQRPSRTGPRLEPVPIAAILALTEIDESAATPVIAKLLKDPTTSAGTRWRLEKSMYHLRQPASYETLVEELRVVPQSVESTMVRGLSGSAGGGAALLAAIESGKLSPRLLRDPRVNVNLQYADIDNLDARIAKLVEGLPTEDERLTELIQFYRAGFVESQYDADRGDTVFMRACSICHSVRGKGARIGPELDGIGMRGLDRLLEDIIDPNRNVDPSFLASVVSLRDGQIATGRILDNDGQVLTLVDYQGVEQKYILSDVSNTQQIKMSTMPNNLTETMTESEFYDLLSYLLVQRQISHKNP